MFFTDDFAQKVPAQDTLPGDSQQRNHNRGNALLRNTLRALPLLALGTLLEGCAVSAPTTTTPRTGNGTDNGTGITLATLGSEARPHPGGTGEPITGVGVNNWVSYAELPGTGSTGITLDLLTTDAQPLAGGDTLSGIENVVGSDRDDIIQGNTADNTFRGGTGADELEGREGGDTLDGGLGSDTASYASSLAGVHVNLAVAGGVQGANFGDTSIANGDAAGDTLISIENVIGSEFDDVFVGNSEVNVLDGGEGSNTASYAGSTGGAVTIVLDDDGSATGSGGDAEGDTLTSIENLVGGQGDDSLTGNSGDNVLEGGVGGDTIVGGEGDETDGDTVSYANAAQLGTRVTAEVFGVEIGSFDGVVVDLTDADGSNNEGEAKNDKISEVENVRGSKYDDYLKGKANEANELDGGAGSDTVDYSEEGSAVTVDLRNEEQTAGGGDRLISIENVIGTAEDGDSLTGAENEDNVLEGGAGADTIDGGGGSGSDTASYASSDSAVYVDLRVEGQAQAATYDFNGDGTETDNGDATGDTLTDIENVRGSVGADVFVGNSAANVLDGGAGSDTVDYSAETSAVTVDLRNEEQTAGGNDRLISIENVIGSRTEVNTLTGNAEDNLFAGGASADTIVGGDQGTGGDTVSYASSTDAVEIALAEEGSSATGSGGDAEGDTLTGIENLIGGQGDDTLAGNSLANVLDGGAGSDTVSYASSTGAVEITLAEVDSSATGSGGNAAGDTLTSIENLIGSDSDDADTLTGNSGDNVLEGGDGGDFLDGGSSGSDTASYKSSGGAVAVDLSQEADTGGGADDGFIVVVDATTGSHANGDRLGSIENLIGSAFADTLTGAEDEDNVLEGGVGADTIDGGEGTETKGDWASYENYERATAGNSGVSVDLIKAAAGTAQDMDFDFGNGVEANGDAAGDILSNIENLRGSKYNDDLAGDGVINILEGGKGDDALDGKVGADVYRFRPEDGTDTIIDTNGANTLHFISSADFTYDSSNADNFQVKGFGAFDIVIRAFMVVGEREVEVNRVTITNYRQTTTDFKVYIGEGIDNEVDLSAFGEVTGGTEADPYVATGGADTASDTFGRTTGNFWVSYRGSDDANEGVTVDLALGTQLTSGVGSYAAGDTLGAGITNLIGSSQSDILKGRAGEANHLRGGVGNDVLEGRGGGDTLDGGLGSRDTVSYENVEELTGDARGSATVGGKALRFGGVVVDLNNDSNNDGGAKGDTIIRVENVLGSGFADYLKGRDDLDRNETLDGGAGDDFLEGQGILQGGAGSDSYIFNASDSLFTDISDSAAAAETDRVYFINDSNDYALTSFKFSKSGDILSITAKAGTSPSQTIGVTDFFTLSGGHEYEFHFGADIDNATQINTLVVGVRGDNVDDLAGTADADYIFALAGDDTITGSLGADKIDGGAGVDTLDYSGSVDTNGNAAGVTLALAALQGRFSVAGEGGFAEGDLVRNIDNIIGSDENDDLTGNGGVNKLEGGAGNDILNGGGGDDVLDGGLNNDILIGGEGGDELKGGDGDDTASYEYATAGVNASLDTSGPTNTGEAAGDTYDSIENLRGSNYKDMLTGDDDDNALYGLAGDDELDGGLGTDDLKGGAGEDTLVGGVGVDTLDGGAGADIYRFSLEDSSEGAGDRIDDSGNGGAGEINEIQFIGATSDYANSDAFGFTVNETDETVEITVGNDVVTIGISDDFSNPTRYEVKFGTGAELGSGDLTTVANIIYGTAGGDFQKTTNAVKNVVGGDGKDFIFGRAGEDTLQGFSGDDVLVGGADGDNLLGGDGDDVLYGGTGVDNLTGGVGADMLYGGAGKDTYLFGRGVATDAQSGAGGSSTEQDTIDDQGSGETLANSLRFDSIFSSGYQTHVVDDGTLTAADRVDVLVLKQAENTMDLEILGYNTSGVVENNILIKAYFANDDILYTINYYSETLSREVNITDGDALATPPTT